MTRGQRQFVLADAVIDVAQGFRDHRRRIDALEPGAGFLDDQRQPRAVERHFRAVGQRHMDGGPGRRFGRLRGVLLGALPGALVAIQHIGTRHLVVLAAHQRQFDLILHVLDVKRAALADPPRTARRRLRRSIARRSHARGAMRLRYGPRRRGTPWSSRPRSCRRRISKPCRCGGSPASVAGPPARPAFRFAAEERERLWLRDRERVTSTDPVMLMGLDVGSDAASDAGGRRAGIDLQATAGTPRPWTYFRCRGRSPGSQVVAAPCLPNALSASVTSKSRATRCLQLRGQRRNFAQTLRFTGFPLSHQILRLGRP